MSRTSDRARRSLRARRSTMATLGLCAALLVGTMSPAGAAAVAANGGTASASPTTSSSSTGSAPKSAELAQALQRLMFAGFPVVGAADSDALTCYTKAVSSSEFTPDGARVIVDSTGTGLAAVAGELQAQKLADDAAMLLSTTLREELDACAQAETGTAGKTVSIPVDAITKPLIKLPTAPKVEPNLTPSQSMQDRPEVLIGSQMTAGVVTMFTSLAPKGKAELIASSGDCLSSAIFRAGFSQASLRFLAEGAPLGVGTVAEHLAGDDDKKLWNSPAFIASLAACLRPGAQTTDPTVPTPTPTPSPTQTDDDQTPEATDSANPTSEPTTGQGEPEPEPAPDNSIPTPTATATSTSGIEG